MSDYDSIVASFKLSQSQQWLRQFSESRSISIKSQSGMHHVLNNHRSLVCNEVPLEETNHS